MFSRFLVVVSSLLVFSSALLAKEQSASGRTAVVLCYHIVESPKDPKMELSRDQFLRQMNYLSSTGYNVIPLADLLDYVAGRKDSIPDNAVVITVDDGWRSTYTEVFPEMKRLGLPFTAFIYPSFIGGGGHAMNWGQVKEMAEAGVDIQSHSYSHPFLTQRRHRRFDNDAYDRWLQTELVTSKKLIEEHIGKPVRAIAYPYGDYDSLLTKATAAAGYDLGLTCDFGRVVKGSDPLRMRRVSIYGDTSFDTFRSEVGAHPMKVEQQTPTRVLDRSRPIVAARIADYRNLDPGSVGMTILSLGTTSYSYNPKDGAISLVVRQPLQDNRQQAIIWGNDARTGKRYEALWTFYLTQPQPEPRVLPPPPAPVVPEVVPGIPVDSAAPPSDKADARPIEEKKDVAASRRR